MGPIFISVFQSSHLIMSPVLPACRQAGNQLSYGPEKFKNFFKSDCNINILLRITQLFLVFLFQFPLNRGV